MTDTHTPNPSDPAPRRRWLRRTALAALFAGAAAGLGHRAWAHRRGHGALDPGQAAKRVERMLRHLYAEIDATEAQKAKLDPIVRSAVADLAPLRGKLREARKQALALLGAATIDRDAIETLRAAQVTLAADASKRLTLALADAAEVLTSAQRGQLAEHLARRRRRWHHG